MIMKIRRKVLIMAILALLAITALSVTAEDSSAGSLSITDVEQKLNENTGDYYLFIYFNENLSGVGEASIIETGFHSAYNVDEQNIKDRLVFIIGAIIGKEYIVCFLNGFIIEAECLVGNLLNFYSTIICCRL